MPEFEKEEIKKIKDSMLNDYCNKMGIEPGTMYKDFGFLIDEMAKIQFQINELKKVNE